MRGSPLLGKFVAVTLLTLLLLVPLAMIRGIVTERQGLGESVEADIARSAFGAQVIGGPILVVPYKERTKREHWDGKRTIITTDWTSRFAYFLPIKFDIGGSAKTKHLYRGLHKALLYESALKFEGVFAVPADFGMRLDAQIELGKAYLALGVSDTRGIRAVTLDWDGASISLAPGSRIDALGAGIHAPLSALRPAPARSHRFAIALALGGTRQLSLTPLGDAVQVHLDSSWPHPSFNGLYLPSERDVRGDGFSARRHLTHFATNLREKFDQCAANKDACAAFRAEQLGVAFVEPADVYQQAERALKYPMLFISLTFIAFLLFELLKRLAIHPIQYGLVGVALAMFFLLLLTLSEHIDFALAYLSAASACVLIIGTYGGYVLRSIARGIGFATLLAGLYGVLFLVIRSEDYALLMGSLLLFGALAMLMFITRKVDWYELGGSLRRGDGATPDRA